MTGKGLESDRPPDPFCALPRALHDVSTLVRETSTHEVTTMRHDGPMGGIERKTPFHVYVHQGHRVETQAASEGGGG